MATHEARAYLIAYDIADPKRLVRVHRFLVKHAMALQYSVFAGVFTPFQVTAAAAGVRERIDAREDDVRIYPLPRRCYALTLGEQWTPDGVFLTDRRLMDLWRTRLAGQTGGPPEETRAWRGSASSARMAEEENFPAFEGGHEDKE